MKTKLLILLAAVAMLFTACKKDQNPEKNYIVYDGVTYVMQPYVEPSDYEPDYAYLGGRSDKVEFGLLGFGSVDYNVLNSKTYDLSEEFPPEFDLFIGNVEEGEWDILFIDYGSWTVNGEDYGLPFESGSLKTTHTNDTYTFVLDGKLGNGKKLSINMEWTDEWIGNH